MKIRTRTKNFFLTIGSDRSRKRRYHNNFSGDASFGCTHAAFLTGFTLPEMLVTMGILVLVSGIILVNHRRFESALTINSLAYEIALAMRQAQVFSLGVRGTGSNFEVAHGVHFERSTPTIFFLFLDTNDDARYNPGTDQIIETFSLRGGSRIVDLCVNNGTQCSLEALDIVYERPNPDANITSFDGVTRLTGRSDATIRLRSSYDVEKTVRASLPGQISVPG